MPAKYTLKPERLAAMTDSTHAPYVCRECKDPFPNERSLSFHFRSHPKANAKLNKFACDKCPETFQSYAGLYQHKRREHRPGRKAQNGSNGSNGHSRTLTIATPAAVPLAHHVNGAEVNHCPQCGCNIEAVRMALRFAAGQR